MNRYTATFQSNGINYCRLISADNMKAAIKKFAELAKNKNYKPKNTKISPIKVKHPAKRAPRAKNPLGGNFVIVANNLKKPAGKNVAYLSDPIEKKFDTDENKAYGFTEEVTALAIKHFLSNDKKYKNAGWIFSVKPKGYDRRKPPK